MMTRPNLQSVQAIEHLTEDIALAIHELMGNLQRLVSTRNSVWSQKNCGFYHGSNTYFPDSNISRFEVGKALLKPTKHLIL